MKHMLLSFCLLIAVTTPALSQQEDFRVRVSMVFAEFLSDETQAPEQFLEQNVAKSLRKRIGAETLIEWMETFRRDLKGPRSTICSLMDPIAPVCCSRHPALENGPFS